MPKRKRTRPKKRRKKSELPKRTHVRTIVDDICEYLKDKERMQEDFGVLSKNFGVDVSVVERIAKVLQERGVAEIIYPVNVFSKPVIRLKKVFEEAPPEELGDGRVRDLYRLSKKTLVEAAIVDFPHEMRPIYMLFRPLILSYTRIYMEHMKDELARMIPIRSEEITDPRHLVALKERFRNAVFNLIDKELPKTENAEYLSEALLCQMYGLGDIELLMLDDWLEDIAINGASNPIAVYHRKYGWLKTNLRIGSEEEIYNYATQIGRKAGRTISLLNPIMDAHLISGDRVAATLFPISTSGDTITIRRFARNPWTIIDFISPELHTLSVNMAAFLWLAIQYELNILVIGGTASGKTSMLNTLCALIPASQRTITIEDTRELVLPSYLKWNWVPLTTRNPNPEGLGGVEMIDLMVTSLRMRPDRIIVGEIRRRREAEVLFEAMHTGHAVYSTVHADNGAQLIRRLTQPPIELPSSELEALHLIVVQYRDRRKGIRRTYEIAEVSAAGVGGVTLNTLYRWRPRTDSFDNVSESIRTIEELNIHTGMTLPEIKEDIAEKEKVLQWAFKHNWKTVDEVGLMVGRYYKEPDEVLRAVRKDVPPSEIFTGV